MQSGETQELRFSPGSNDLRILQDIWGPDTNVYVENFVYEDSDKPLKHMECKHLMRAKILRK
eukprot:4222814-Ditylum_brightwellii.AAC.1